MTELELKDKLSELVADPFATREEIEAVQKLLAETENRIDNLAPAEPVISSILDSSIRERKIGVDLNAGDVMFKGDYEEVAALGKRLGIDATRTAQLYSQLEAVCGGSSNTRLGLFALRVLVENCYLHRVVADFNALSNGAVFQLIEMHKPKDTEGKNGKKKSR